jgi:hypothetical protein
MSTDKRNYQTFLVINSTLPWPWFSYICLVFNSLFHYHFSEGNKLINGEITGHDAVRTFGAMPRPSNFVSARGSMIEFVLEDLESCCDQKVNVQMLSIYRFCRD